jgi:ketosteroid isomerase-like protein
MNRDTAIDLLDRLHKAQNEFYAGGSGAALEQLLAPNITWTVPADNRIAGNYRGLKEVFGYLRRRRNGSQFPDHNPPRLCFHRTSNSSTGRDLFLATRIGWAAGAVWAVRAQ